MITFAPQCTLPESGPVFVQQPNVRSTMDIIWGSLVVIFLCSWSILHLNVPPNFRPAPRSESTWRSLRRNFITSWLLFKRKLGWMIVTIMLPEYVLGLAAEAFMSARKCTKQIREFQRENESEDDVNWTWTHSMYANMGGIILKFPRPTVDDSETTVKNGSSTEGNSNVRATDFLNKFRDNNQSGHPLVGPFDWDPHPQHFSLAKEYLRGSYRLISNEVVDSWRTARLLSGDTWTVTASQILECRRIGIIPQLPNITEAQILDKSKSSPIITGLALVQISWLVIQLIIRAVEKRQSSQIEITALAFAVCALFTYILLWRHPKDVVTPTVITPNRSPNQDEFDKLVDAGLFVASFETTSASYALPISTTTITTSDFNAYSNSMLLALSIFGAVHLVAWNIPFPSQIEQLLWRICAVIIAAAPLSLLLAVGIHNMPQFALPHWVQRCVFVTTLLLFVIARLFLLVEAFRSTYYLPPDSYIATWASNIPHIV